MSPPRLRAVFFDLDGTLIDSEPVWEAALRALARRYGAELSEQARIRMVGTSTAESMAILHEDIGQSWRDRAASGAWLEERVAQLYASDLTWRAGARELLAEVRAAGIPTGLVTATRRSLVASILDTLGAANFDVVVCGDDVARAKPDPLPYLTAAQRLGVAPKDTVAIEDSPTGAASAHAAGCAVIAVPSTASFTQADPYLVLPSLVQADLRLLRTRLAGNG